DKPQSWPGDIFHSAVAAGNTVMIGTGEDFGVDVALLGEKIALDGFAINGFASRPGLGWRLVGLRSEDGVPIYQPDLQNGRGGNRKSTRLNSSHVKNSYAVFCLKKKNKGAECNAT